MNIIKVTYLLQGGVQTLRESKNATASLFKKPNLTKGSHEFPYFDVVPYINSKDVKCPITTCTQVTYLSIRQVAMMLSNPKSKDSYIAKEQQLISGKKLNTYQLAEVLRHVDDIAFDLNALGWKFEFLN